MMVVRARDERIMLLMKGELMEVFGFRVWKLMAAAAAAIRYLLNI